MWVPYNHNRVVLSTQDGRSCIQTYINASFIEEPMTRPKQDVPRSWIIAQAPKNAYVANFLSMLIYAPHTATPLKHIPAYTDSGAERPLITFEESNCGRENLTPNPTWWPSMVGQSVTWSSDTSGPGASPSSLAIAVTLLSQTAWIYPLPDSVRKWRVNILRLQHGGRKVQVRHLEVWTHVSLDSTQHTNDGNEVREALLNAIDDQFSTNSCPIVMYEGILSLFAGQPLCLIFIMSALTTVFRNLHFDRHSNALMTLRSRLAKAPLGIPAGSVGSSNVMNAKYEDVSSIQGIDPILAVMDYFDDHRQYGPGSIGIINEIRSFADYWWEKHCKAPRGQPQCRHRST